MHGYGRLSIFCDFVLGQSASYHCESDDRKVFTSKRRLSQDLSLESHPKDMKGNKGNK